MISKFISIFDKHSPTPTKKKWATWDQIIYTALYCKGKIFISYSK